MIPYIFLYAIIFLFPILGKAIHDKRKRKYIYCIFVFGTILLLIGLRHPSMGNDLPGYLKSFHRLNQKSWGEILALDSYLNYEKGYILFNKLIGMLTLGNEQMFLFICAMLATVPVGYMVYKKSQDSLLSMVIYLGLPIFLIQYSALRQAIALGICFASLTLIEEGKLGRFLICIFIASTFHYSSIVFILAYFLYHVHISKNMRLILFSFLPIVYVFRVQLFRIFSVLLKDNAVITQTNAYTMMIVLAGIYFLVMILLFNYNDDKQVNGYMNIFFCACLCQIFSSVHNTVIRVTYYFMIVLVLLLPIAINRNRNDKMVIVLRWVIILSFVAFAFDSIMSGSWARAYPYYFFWQM